MILFKILPFHIHNKYLSSSSRVAGGQSKQPGPICNCGRRNIGQQLYDPWPGGVTWPVVSDGVIITPSIPRPPLSCCQPLDKLLNTAIKWKLQSGPRVITFIDASEGFVSKHSEKVCQWYGRGLFLLAFSTCVQAQNNLERVYDVKSCRKDTL